MVSDDEKVRARQRQLDAEQEELIASLGEAGHKSGFYTGSLGLISWNDERRPGQQAWTRERDLWTQTGEKSHLRQMLAAVDFQVPLDAADDRAQPVPKADRRLGQVRSRASDILAAVSVMTVMVIVIAAVALTFGAAVFL